MSACGSLRIIGLGPGGGQWLTPEASELIAKASDLIGYAPYLERLPQIKGQRRHASGNGAEMERARHGLRLAESGCHAAIVSGGDPGVFAMAAAVFEAIEEEPRWLSLDVAVSPGISAMQAAAARAGAPLGHDFCAISLSDNLKPWPLVKRRLCAAASADFVIAIYNPASAARPNRIHEAFALLRALKDASTPVVFVRAAGRPNEDIAVETLAAADPARADMNTLIIVGSSETRIIPRENAAPFVYTSRRAS
ncbi:MAG: precorrin-3B C(17)-methyltransferase [Beijerinckiaceae bacterium]|nr:precorrin-3B C(17)-methyltransferase [Beijerinckiaceae bacterium]